MTRPPFLWAVIDASALRREVGSPKIMHDALLNLAGVSQLPNVTVQILTDPVHVGLQGGFIIAETPGSAGIIALDDIVDGRLADDTVTVAEASLRFRWLQSEALGMAASRALIERTVEEQWTA